MAYHDILVEYHKSRTYSPEIYAKHLAIQQIGHMLGWKSTNTTVPPRGVSHNTYIAILGQSGKSKKSTAQNDTIGKLYDNTYLGPSSFSPEGLLKHMSDQPQMYCPLGEFSTILRSIKQGGHMSRFKEISNDLFTRRDSYVKKLVSCEYAVPKPYLSMSTTCTPEEFVDNLEPTMYHGGFLPRWLLVYSEAPKRVRISLPANIMATETRLKVLNYKLYEYFQANPVRFEFTNDAYKLWMETQEEWEDSEEYENVQPFVARYINYVAIYADILRISKEIGKMFSLKTLADVSNVTSDTKVTSVTSKSTNGPDDAKTGVSKKSRKSRDSRVSLVSTVTLVTLRDIEQAIELVKPCLAYAKRLVSNIDEDYYVAKINTAFDGHKALSNRDLLRKTKELNNKLEPAIQTLIQREELEQKVVENENGRKIRMYYKIN